MERLVDWVAPRTTAGLVLRAVAFLVLINLLNVAMLALRGAPFRAFDDIANTTAVGMPFVVFILALMRHQRSLQARLMVLATTDLLTGLPNRRHFLSRARAATSGGRTGALLMLDADHFKRINDRWGHAIGDACLSAIADRLRESLRPHDLVGRLGGEEFAVFLPAATREEAMAIGERLCERIAVEVSDAEEALAFTLSAGAALGDGATPLDHLMIEADLALYEAKAQGRARVVLRPLEKVRAA